MSRSKPSVWCGALAACVACGGAPTPSATLLPASDASWSYALELTESGALQARVAFAAGTLDDEAELSVTEGAEAFVLNATTSRGKIAQRGSSWFLTGCAPGCSVSYRFALADAARSLGEDGVANRVGGASSAWQAPFGAFTLRPLTAKERDVFALRFAVPSGFAVATGAVTDGGGTYRGRALDLGRGPYTLFGRIVAERFTRAGTHVTLAVGPGGRTTRRDELRSWVDSNVSLVASALGRFPLDGVMVAVLPGPSGRVGFGRAMAAPTGGSILVDVGEDATAGTFAGDWVLLHELIHLGFPSLARRHRWMEEGLATYWEPLLRARAGLAAREEVWGDFVSMMQNGRPEAGDAGLDHTPTWGRVYWGGALFCFVADVQIRRATKGARSLDDALRGILAAGGHNGARWSIEQTFQVGDEATGTRVLSELYRAWAHRAVDVDLDALFRELGVSRRADGVTFDDAAPLARLRDAMTGRDERLAAAVARTAEATAQ